MMDRQTDGRGSQKRRRKYIDFFFSSLDQLACLRALGEGAVGAGGGGRGLVAGSLDVKYGS